MNSRYVLVGIILAVALAAGVVVFKKQRHVEPPKRIEEEGLKSKGPVDAPVQIVEYSDFQCPACQLAQAQLDQVMADYAGKVRIIFYHFPLPGHLWSGMVHQAAECANRTGKFWPYHDRLYKEQKTWSVSLNPAEFFLNYARDLGLSPDKFAACLADAQTSRHVMAEKARGENLQISSTPTFFINGERVVGPVELREKGINMIRKGLNLPPLPPAPKTETSQPSPSPGAASSQGQAPQNSSASGPS